jgi:hypothetical protein
MNQPKAFLMSLGYLSQLLQKSPAAIERILDEAGIAPAVSINGVRHYDEAAYLAVSDDLERQPPKESQT